MKTLLDYLDQSATDADRRYLILTDALIAETRRGMIGQSAFSPAEARRVKNNLILVGRSSLSSEELRIESTISELTESANRAAFDHLGLTLRQSIVNAPSDALTASEETSISYLLGEITSQVNRDVNQALKDYRNAALRAVMKADLTGVSRDNANSQVMLEEMNARRKLWFTDKSGRKVKSNLHIRRIWRQAIKDHWMQVYLQVLSSNDISEAVLWHPDISHRHYGETLSITEPDYGLPDHQKVFHPNSRAIPVARSFMEMTS